MEQKQKQSPVGTFKIGGISVEFPYKPYGSQLAYMGKVVATLERAQRQGHCHALLESPTGTGKSLALLCATLAWQQQHSSKIANLQAQPPPSQSLPAQPPRPPPPPPTPSQAENALVMGGGFIPEQTQSGVAAAAGESQQAASGVDNGAERKPKVPTIFYASRTHSQITQVIREYRKTAYRVPMAVLASRKHYCTNKRVCSKKNVDEECKLLLRDTEQSCQQFKYAYKVKYHESLKKGGCNEVHDIEDLVKVGHMVKGCSYFAARDMALSARLVFCPYSYILNPIIRRAMEVDVKGDIVILDEAHNIEDMCREAGSLDVEENVLDALQSELGQLSLIEGVVNIYQPLLDMVQGLLHWIRQKSNNLVKREFERYCSCWTGDKALRELQAAGISQDHFPILEQCATQAIKAASDPEKDGVHLSGLSASTLEGLFSSLSYFFSQNGRSAFDYQLCLQKYVKRDDGMSVKGWTHSFNLWCLNPAVVFKEIAKASLSVILTSGTLSPLNSFASELGVPFEICMEAPHVINMDSQVWAASVAAGPQCVPLNASYKTADGYEFQDALGAVLEEICKIVPDGTLIFFPSYKLMDKLCNRWKATGQWIRLNSQKTIFVEPRGNQDDFEPVLSGYYRAICGEKKGIVRKVKNAHKQVPKYGNSKDECHHRSNGGAAFLAVCRGKVSEGIDFADENARAVVVVGIPFPNKKDIQVELKKQYNDTYKSSKNLLSGDQWYCQQAFRTLNQAVGRCIRHRLDFGAIILLDERFKRARNLEYMSKWLRSSIRQFDNFGESLEGLRDFFSRYQDQKPEILTGHNLITKCLLMDDSDLLICKENSSVPNVKASAKEVTENVTHKIEDFFSSRRSKKDNSITQKVKSARDSIEKIDYPGDANTRKNEYSITKPAIQVEDDFSDGEDHFDSNQIIQKHSKYFKQSSLQETIGIESSLQETIDIESTLKIEDPSTKINLSSTHFSSLNEAESVQVCQVETARQAVAANGSSQVSLASPCLVNGSTSLVYGERFNASNLTPSRGSEGEFVSNHYTSTSVGMSGSNSCRKKRSPIRCQLDCERKTLLFGQLTESNNLHQQDQVECSMSPQNKVISCQKIGNLCSGGNALSPLDSQCESTFFSSSTARSTVVESLDCGDNGGGVMVQTESIQSSDLRTTKPVPDSSLCSSPEHKYKLTAVASKDIAEKTYSISCKFCGKFFGLPEKHFRVRCTVASLSKSYVSGLANGQQDRQSNVDTFQDRPAVTPVIISDIACLNPLFTRSGSKQCSLTSRSADDKRESVWVEQDGCVFRALFCPRCEASKISVGVHVVATDVSNMSLLGKVIFLRDHVKLIDAEPSVSREVHEHQNNINVSNAVDVSSIEDYSYNSNPKRARYFSTARTKLKLPKKD
ncbi:hypothetical protein SUGI_0626920 [Cryptomeria japonica]|nr:hypothetical protein SUGI_0626920 [Cryptomeria japonica]